MVLNCRRQVVQQWVLLWRDEYDRRLFGTGCYGLRVRDYSLRSPLKAGSAPRRDRVDCRQRIPEEVVIVRDGRERTGRDASYMP